MSKHPANIAHDAKLGNKVRTSGVDRCPCGCKYWEHDACIDCGGTLPMPEDDNEARTILAEAVGAMNNLILYLNNNPDIFPEGVRQAFIEADWMINSAASDVADFVGEYPAPTV
jgi:hypothetical protein